MADIISLQELADAKLDAQSLEQFINGGVDEEVLTRLSQQYPTIKKLLLEFQKYNGRAYKTYAEMDADKANLSPKTKVTVTNDAIDSNNGDWQWDGVAFTKSAHDPVEQAKAYADGNAFFKPVILQSGADLRNLSFDGYFEVNSNTANILNLPEAVYGFGFREVDQYGHEILWYFAKPLARYYSCSKWNGVWSDWVQSGDAKFTLQTSTQKTGTQALSNYTENGVWTFSTSATITDLPVGAPIGQQYTLYVNEIIAGGIYKTRLLRCNTGTANTGKTWFSTLNKQTGVAGAWSHGNRLHDKQVVFANLSADYRYAGKPDGTDLDTLTDDGVYTVVNAINRPTNVSNPSGFVEVENHANGSFVIQKWRTLNAPNEIRTRQLRPTQVPPQKTEWFAVGGSSNSVFTDKNLLCMGDSITRMGTYPAQIASRLGFANGYNSGFSGCRWAKHSNELYTPFSAYSVANYILTDTLPELMDAAITLRDSQYADNKTAQVAVLQSIDFTTLEYITIFYGTNDFSGNVPIGSDTDMTGDTFKGAINLTLDRLLTKNPNFKILLISPIWRARQNTGDGLESDSNPNSLGLYLRDYVKAIEEMANKNHVPFINLYDTSMINARTELNYLSDGLHQNAAGDTHLANLIAAKLSSTY